MKRFNLLWLSACLLFFMPALAQAELSTSDKQAITQLVEGWNQHLNGGTSPAGQDLYAPQVEWFGQHLERDDVLRRQQAFTSHSPDYTQRIISTLDMVEDETGHIQVEFVKQAGLEAKQLKNYPAQLTLSKQPAGWRISGETDLLTRLNQKETSVQGLLAKGKFDGSNKDVVWVNARDPKTGGSCDEEGDCDCKLWSSNPEVQPAVVPQCIGGAVETLSQLDDSGRDRVVVFPQWWTSAWRVVYVFDIQKGQWTKALPSFPMNINIQEEDDAATLVKRDTQHSGNVLVKKALWDEKQEDIVTPQKSEPLLVAK
ncbi:hypothetical protein [Enterobacter sp. Bisph1]|uniref:hypothetical protein n=1 Tax=Enterobacter sp. Bisph1 TaxID=1274399 RepID=UPI00057BEB04|nr:hypothetical protein [Enterobacter sp. Bisph1]